MRRGHVLIETLEGDSNDPRSASSASGAGARRRDRAFNTTCNASVVLSLDPATGMGTVLYSTPLLWEYAYARENNGFKGDRLFKMLHARKYAASARVPEREVVAEVAGERMRAGLDRPHRVIHQPRGPPHTSTSPSTSATLRPLPPRVSP